MKAGDLRLEELVTFDEGHIDLQGRRLALRSMHALAQLRRDLQESVGPVQTRSILTRYGYYWGQADAAAMNRVFEWDNLREWVKAGTRMLTLQGAADATVKSLKIDEASGRFRMEVTLRHSGEAEEVLDAFGRSDECVCWMSAGYASGYASFCMGRDIYFIEQKCRGKGDRVCSALGMDEAAWGDALTEHLPYFRAEDIQGRILALSQELRQRTAELATHRERLGELEQVARPFFVEVRSETFRRAMALADQVARFDASVLITGETGTGKEVLARYIHRRSRRAKGPFVAVNCAALPETLLESELFGHKMGAFTGAVEDRVGLFEYAQNGTVFLDEIGDVSSATQSKLLRVLQEKEIVRVGESAPRRIDVRVLAATNRDPEQDVREGRFREDLLYRLRVIEIEVPPLRERIEDVLPLTRYFVERFAKRLDIPRLQLDARCVDILQDYSWPGNVRELENAIERAAVLSEAGRILPEHLPPRIVHADPAAPTRDNVNRTLARAEDDHIRAVLKFTDGNRTRAAKILDISPTTLWRRLKQTAPDGK